MSEQKKMGRPKKDITREKHINIRLTSEELEKMDKVARKLKATRTDAIMQGIDRLYNDLDA